MEFLWSNTQAVPNQHARRAEAAGVRVAWVRYRIVLRANANLYTRASLQMILGTGRAAA